MEFSENKRGYGFEDLIHVVKRENNLRRSFLFLNRSQAKYIPSDPDDTIGLFRALGEKALELCPSGKVGVIGFAETATALGAFVAQVFSTRALYLHTTRECLCNAKLLVSFEEEHSHAKGHELYCKNPEKLRDCDTIIFVDDELTTGKTICNFIDELRREQLLKPSVKLMAASLLNCMEESRLKLLGEQGIECVYLMREYRRWEETAWTGADAKDVVFSCASAPGCTALSLGGYVDARTGIDSDQYRHRCDSLIEDILKTAPVLIDEQTVLVLGTEEFMYPAILYAQKLKRVNEGISVKVHATSRSPIVPMVDQGYPIRNRSMITSVYSEARRVYLYNLAKYDRVFILTDANPACEKGIADTLKALKTHGNENITVIQWRE